MPLYTVHVKIETDIEVAAADRLDAIERTGQLELGRFITPANATVVGVTEDIAAEIPDEQSGEGDSGEGDGQ